MIKTTLSSRLTGSDFHKNQEVKDSNIGEDSWKTLGKKFSMVPIEETLTLVRVEHIVLEAISIRGSQLFRVVC